MCPNREIISSLNCQSIQLAQGVQITSFRHLAPANLNEQSDYTGVYVEMREELRRRQENSCERFGKLRTVMIKCANE